MSNRIKKLLSLRTKELKLENLTAAISAFVMSVTMILALIFCVNPIVSFPGLFLAICSGACAVAGCIRVWLYLDMSKTDRHSNRQIEEKSLKEGEKESRMVL